MTSLLVRPDLSTTVTFQPTDLVLFVWPHREPGDPGPSGDDARREAALTPWAMGNNKAERVRVLVSVVGSTIVGAWSVSGTTSVLTEPKGKSRRVNRATFEAHDDPRLHFLAGQSSQLRPRRNPQTTIELRDLWGSEVLLASAPEDLDHGVVRVGAFTLTVREDGSADLIYPAQSPVTLRPERW